MKQRILGVLTVVVLTAFGCQSTEERQAQELREALRQIVDEIEELQKEELALLRAHKEIVDAIPPRITELGFDLTAGDKAFAKSHLERVEKSRPEILAQLRQDVEGYTDAELPMLALSVRGRRSAAESNVGEAKKSLGRAQQEKKAAEDRAAKEAARSAQ